MKNLAFVLFLIVGVASASAQIDDTKQTVVGKLNSATIYYAGAEMQHGVSVNLKKGTTELTITDISNQVDINSIQIKAPSSVTILSSEYSNAYVAPEKRSDKLQKLDDSLAALQKELKKYNNTVNNNSQLLEMLKKNQPGSNSNDKKALEVAELIKYVDYYKGKATELQNEQLQAEEKVTTINQNIDKVRKQINEELKATANKGGRLILRVSSLLEIKADLSFSYLTPNAAWIPNYDIRANDLKKPLQAKCKARVWQTTGIDWKQVKLSLSTAMPSQYSVAPVLSQWFLTYVYPAYSRNSKAMTNSIQAYDLEEVVMDSKDYKKAEASVRAPELKQKQQPPVYIVDGQIIDVQQYYAISHLVKNTTFLEPSLAVEYYGSQAAGGAYVLELKNNVPDYVAVSENAMSTNFNIDLLYDIPTTGKMQSIDIQDKEIPVLFKYYSVPKLGEEAFLLAEVPNWSSLNLLDGEANIIFEDTYVGKTNVSATSVSDTLNLTIAKDKRVTVKRQKLEDFTSSKVLNSSKLQKFTYEITVKNNRNEAINMMLKDQYPLSTLKEIEVELLDSGNAVVNSTLGVLTWHFNLAAGESKKFTFTYTVKYPKDKTLNL